MEKSLVDVYWKFSIREKIFRFNTLFNFVLLSIKERRDN